jgi:hypothetical protein
VSKFYQTSQAFNLFPNKGLDLESMVTKKALVINENLSSARASAITTPYPWNMAQFYPEK